MCKTCPVLSRTKPATSAEAEGGPVSLLVFLMPLLPCFLFAAHPSISALKMYSQEKTAANPAGVSLPAAAAPAAAESKGCPASCGRQQ